MAESYIKKVSAGGGKTKINYTNAGVLIPIYGTASSINYTSSNPATLSLGGYSSRVVVATASVGNHVLFAGGSVVGGTVFLSLVDAYNSSLTRTTVTSLSETKNQIGASSNANFAIFAGGWRSGQKSSVDAYNASLTRSTPTAYSTAMYDFAGTTVGNFAIFGGGTGDQGLSDVVNTYDLSLTRAIQLPTNVRARANAACRIGNFALFGGGEGASYASTNIVTAYNTSLSRTQPSNLTNGATRLGGSQNQNFGIFAGGVGTNYWSTVNAYNTSLTKSNPTSLSVARLPYYSSAQLIDNAVFIGGQQSGGNGISTAVDSYNNSLTRTILPALNSTSALPDSGTVGNKIIVHISNSTRAFELPLISNSYQLTTPTLSDFVITYNYDFNTIGTGTVGEGATLSSSTTFTGFLEIPEEVT
jgi:hypothetical protein